MRQSINFRNLATPSVFTLPFGKIAKDQQSLPHRAILASTPVTSRTKPGAVGVVVTLPADQQPGAGRGFSPVYGVAGLEPYAQSGFPPRVEAKNRWLSGRRPLPPRPLIMAGGRRGMAGPNPWGTDETVGGRSDSSNVGANWWRTSFVDPAMEMASTRPWLMGTMVVGATLVMLSLTRNVGRVAASASA